MLTNDQVVFEKAIQILNLLVDPAKMKAQLDIIMKVDAATRTLAQIGKREEAVSSKEAGLTVRETALQKNVDDLKRRQVEFVAVQDGHERKVIVLAQQADLHRNRVMEFEKHQAAVAEMAAKRESACDVRSADLTKREADLVTQSRDLSNRVSQMRALAS